MSFDEFLSKIENISHRRIKKLHRLSKRIWANKKLEPMDLRNKCLDRWELLADQLGTKITPLIQIPDDHPASNSIFGSGSFSTGTFQIEQYKAVEKYTDNSPMILNGIVSNKSLEHGCNGKKIAKFYNIPYAELDFIDWYQSHIDAKERNPIRATRYWYQQEETDKPSTNEIYNRFKIRQDQFHKELGEIIEQRFSHLTQSVSARGYNFQFCSNIFKFQNHELPHINDTHPADLRYIDPKTKEKLYAGWQAGAIELMINDKIHSTYHGSLIEVNYMDNLNQINQLDEGVLLALSEGITPEADLEIPYNAKEIQSAMKIMDDYFFCSLEPTGLIYLWGVTENAIPIKYLTKSGEIIEILQKGVVVGNKLYHGNKPWGTDLENDLEDVDSFLFP